MRIEAQVEKIIDAATTLMVADHDPPPPPTVISSSTSQTNVRWDVLAKDMRAMARTMQAFACNSGSSSAGFANGRDSNSRKKWIKLGICVMLDLIGSGGLGFPLLGDLLDVFTAPVSALMLHALFASNAVTVAGLTEELLPGTDGIPSATLAWVAEQRGYINNNETPVQMEEDEEEEDDEHEM